MATTRIATPADLEGITHRLERDLYSPVVSAFAIRGIYLERRNAGRSIIPGKGRFYSVTIGKIGTPDFSGWTCQSVTACCLGWIPNSRSRCKAKDCAGHTAAPGTVVSIEVKPPGWVPANRAQRIRFAMQRAYLDRVLQTGGLAWMIYGPDNVGRVFV